MNSVSVIGCGKLGAPMAALFAYAGFDTIAYDLDQTRARALADGRSPVEEPGVQDLLDMGPRPRLGDPGSTDLAFIVVPTPSTSSGAFDPRYVIEALKATGDKQHVVIVSTVSPGTMQMLGRDRLSYSPEFIALGNVIADMYRPSFLLIGEEGESPLVAFYQRLYMRLGEPMPRVARMPFREAEVTKLAVNCYVTMKISFANQIAMIKSIDPHVVCNAVGLDRRIGQAYMKPGTAFGGPCFPRDCAAMLAEEFDLPLVLATDKVNSLAHTSLFLQVMERYPRKVAVLGLSYKTGTHVTDQSAGKRLVERLTQASVEVFAHDPLAAPDDGWFDKAIACDTIVIATPHANYSVLRGTRTGIIDPWGLLH